MPTSDSSGVPPGPRELLLHRFASVAVAALGDGATEDDLRDVLASAVAVWRRRQRSTTGRRLHVVPAST